MKYMGLQEIKEKYLSFFESKAHLRLPSFSLVPKNDKSLLLIAAGMAPLKPYFTGREEPPCHRITTCQKCIRTPDIDRVGITSRHGTFFEMLGNFSFGDYFKREAISFAWEFVLKEMELPYDRLYVTVYQDDDEAYNIWHNEIGLPAEKIFRMGKEDNFWEIGTGPCGPCSEIYFDRGEQYGCGKPDCHVGCDCDRFVEFWNLVFTQFNREEDGTYTELENKNIDTGMGLERLAVIVQGVDNIFEVDTIYNVLKKVCEISGHEYGTDEKNDISIRVITDHIRSTTFMVSDGIRPDNEGRGYVLRRLLRRALRHGKLLGIKDKFITEIAKVVIEENAVSYPVLKEKEDYILTVIEKEESRFYNTLDQGLVILNEYISKLDGNVLDGEKAFKLYDTYGFPIDLTIEIANESNISVDIDGFNAKMAEQKKLARESRKETDYMGTDDEALDYISSTELPTVFHGYDTLSYKTTVSAILNESGVAGEGENVAFLLKETPFYGESGGQTGDMGVVVGDSFSVQVNSVKKYGGRFIHKGTVTNGVIKAGCEVTATVDTVFRNSVRRNHSATHLLQTALRSVLGSHVEQSGSYVSNQVLRFDFSHHSAMSGEELKAVERLVNDYILQNVPVCVKTMSLEEAKSTGAMALFDEKYGDSVRVVSMGSISKELCGGTHVSATGDIGMFKILSEGGVSAGIRRIEAITGSNTYDFMVSKENLIGNICSQLKTTEDNVLKKIAQLQNELKETKKELEAARRSSQKVDINSEISSAKDINGVKVVACSFENIDINTLREYSDLVRNKLETSFTILLSKYQDKNIIVTAATDSAVEKGINCGIIVKEVAQKFNGKGGGRPNMAQGSYDDASKPEDILAFAVECVSRQIKI
ncbi:MAG: alanine--tRNA ligase [Clostridiales bacterium]|nr:alanine--tRNA ligase [Clostridiales bacterium]